MEGLSSSSFWEVTIEIWGFDKVRKPICATRASEHEHRTVLVRLTLLFAKKCV
jgi:hypothetical protein